MLFLKKKKECVSKEEMKLELGEWKAIAKDIHHQKQTIQCDLSADISEASQAMLKKSIISLESEINFVDAHIFRIEEYLNGHALISKSQFALHSSSHWKKTQG